MLAILEYEWNYDSVRKSEIMALLSTYFLMYFQEGGGIYNNRLRGWEVVMTDAPSFTVAIS